MKSFYTVFLICSVFIFFGCEDFNDGSDSSGDDFEYHAYVESLLDIVDEWDIIIDDIDDIVEMLEEEQTRVPVDSEDYQSLKSKISEIKDRLSDALSYKLEILKVASQILTESDSKLAEYAIKDIEANLKKMENEIQTIGEILVGIDFDFYNDELSREISDIIDVIDDTISSGSQGNQDTPGGDGNEGPGEDIGEDPVLPEDTRNVKMITINDGWAGTRRIIEFEYDSDGRMISSEILDEEASYKCNYEYDTIGELHIDIIEKYEGDNYEEQYSSILKIDENGRTESMQSDGTEYKFFYSDKGYLTKIEMNNSGETFSYVYKYQGDYPCSISFCSPRSSEDVFDLNGWYDNKYDSGNINIDLNRVFIPMMYSDSPEIVYSFFNLGRVGAYLPERINTWGGHYNLGTHCPDDITYDEEYTYTVTKTYDEYESYDDYLYTVPIDTYFFNSDGYPTGFESVISCSKRKLEVTFGAGEVIGEDENGKIYKVVEKDSKTTDMGSVEFKFSAVIEYI